MKKIAIITAMREEAEHIVQNYKLQITKKLHTLEVYESEGFVLVLSGIGKIQASIAASYLFLNYKLSYCINIGIAGNLKGDTYKVGDVFIVGEVIQHDIYLPFGGSHLDYAKKSIFLSLPITSEIQNISFGYYSGVRCLTGDQFIDDTQKIKDLHTLYNADVVEMEAFAIASCAREYGLVEKFICIKAISDGADSDAKKAHMGNLDFAMKNSLVILDNFLKNIIE